MIAIIDLDIGNLANVKKVTGGEITNSPREVEEADKIILPGVGSFGPAMDNLKTGGWLEPVRDWIRRGKPFLGICLGMQVLFEASEESPGKEGLSVFPGKCRKFRAGKVPQIGWNNVKFKKEDPIFSGIPHGEYFYFVHGYYVDSSSGEVVLADADYGIEYPAAAVRGKVYGVQFHPEKSGWAGLKLLDNWRRIC